MNRNNATSVGFCVTIAMALLTCPAAKAREADEVPLSVQVGQADLIEAPVCVNVKLPAGLEQTPPEEIAVEILQARGAEKSLVGQIARDLDGRTELWFVAAHLKAGQAYSWPALVRKADAGRAEAFSWNGEKGKHLDLTQGGRTLARYVYAHDASTKDSFLETYKTFLHIFDAEGKDTITKGPGGLYTHHRGIFIGWKFTCAGKAYDLWHMKEGPQVHKQFLQRSAGPVLARLGVLVHWNDMDGKTLIEERRQYTFFRLPAPTLAMLDFQTRLTPVAGDVSLEGDPEHSGVHFRARNEVDVKQTQYLFFSDTVDPKAPTKALDMPWVGMSYVLSDGKRYSVQHMNHPDNPKGTVYSANRAYGRFGAFFKKALKANEPLEIRYRMCVTAGVMPSRQEMQSRYEAFANPPAAAGK